MGHQEGTPTKKENGMLEVAAQFADGKIGSGILVEDSRDTWGVIDWFFDTKPHVDTVVVIRDGSQITRSILREERTF